MYYPRRPIATRCTRSSSRPSTSTCTSRTGATGRASTASRRSKYRPEEWAAPLAKDVSHQGLCLVELHIDRADMHSLVVDEVIGAAGQVFSKPGGQRAHSPGLFNKRDFEIDLRANTIT